MSGYESFKCIAHLIQLSIKDAFCACENLQNLIDKCQRIVKFFKKSAPAMDILLKAQGLCGMNELKLLQNVKTRWNSDFYMIFRVHELKDPLCIAFPKLDIPGLNNEDWKMLEDLIDVLNALEGATKTLCGDTYSTLSMVIPSINKLIEHTTTLTLISKEVLIFRVHIINSLKNRFSEVETNRLMLISTLLDPRFKKSNEKLNLIN